MRASTLTLALLPLLAACGSANPDEVLGTVRATEQSQLEAVAAKDLRGATRNYDPAAVVLAPGGASVRGAPAIESEYGRLLVDPNFAIAMKPGDGWASESGELAVTTATGTVTTTGAGGSPTKLASSFQERTMWIEMLPCGWRSRTSR